MSDGLDLKEFLSGFLAEADEHLGLANRNLLGADAALKAGQIPARQVRELFRSLHTLKGLAAMVAVEPIVDVAHEMETVLRDADRAGGRLPDGAVDVLLAGVRAIEERVSALSLGEPVPEAPQALVSALAALRPAPTEGHARPAVALEPELLARLAEGEKEQLAQATRDGLRVFRIDFRPSPERMAQGLTISSVRERLGGIGDLVKVVPQAVSPGPDAPAGLCFLLLFVSPRTLEEVTAAAGLHPSEIAAVRPTRGAPAAPSPGEPPEELDDAAPLPGLDFDDAEPSVSPQGRTLVRVDVQRLDDALEKLSALVVTRHRLDREVKALAANGADVRALNAILGENARQLRDLRQAVVAARMVPVSQVLERVPLMVRGLSKSTGKAVRLEMQLGDAEVDKAVGERLFPAVVHLLRNAVDHGLESPQRRREAGKPEEGNLRVSCFNRNSAQLELRISDDGRGIDAAEVARSAGAEVPQDAHGLLSLISRPGLSTRESADQTSGRGMGMDIVRRVVEEALGGELELLTAPGRGTTFVLRVPLSITIVDAFTFTVAGERFAVPVSGVEEILEIDPAGVTEPPAPDEGGGRQGKGAQAARRMIVRRGEALPLLSLSGLFSLDAVANGRDEGAQARKALVIRRGGDAVAFAVTQMLGQQEIVVRPLEDPLVRVPGAAGATDLGDGRPTLVLDLPALAGLGRQVQAEGNGGARARRGEA